MLKQFFLKNKVFFTGLLGSLALVVNEFAGQPEVNWLAVGYAGAMAVLAYVANTWRGGGVTITGILGTTAAVAVQLHSTHSFTVSNFILFTLTAIITAVAPPAKPASYEDTTTIKKANADGEKLQEIRNDTPPKTV